MAVRHAVVTLQRVVRRDDASAGTLQWQTVVGTHSPTRIRISLGGLVGAAKQRFDSPNSYRVYYGELEDLHLIASSDEWKAEASILVDECGDGRLSFTLMIGEVVKGNEARAPGKQPVLSVPVSNSAARKAVAALSAVHEHSRRPESAAKPAHDDDGDLEEDEDDDFDEDEDDVPVPGVARAAVGAAAPKSNVKKTLRERALTLQRQCNLNYVAASGGALATILNQDGKKMQDWAPGEVVTELRVQCIPCKNSWKVAGSSVKKAFGKHHDKAHPEEAASRLAMLIDAIKSPEHLAFEEGAFIIVPASCAKAPLPLPQHPPSTLQEPDALEVANDLWRFIATLPSQRLELDGNVQEALKSFYAAHPRHSPRSATLALVYDDIALALVLVFVLVCDGTRRCCDGSSSGVVAASEKCLRL
ncbi:hypothetical protein M885DRAFT_570624 [Pelagophyceae sp. CCMP2097]|nr:hypothetical protein M885DRAFT_570624 [Pelagophyceae sp. CCMP2097]